MDTSRITPSRPRRLGVVVVAVLLVLLALVATASAAVEGSPRFHRGHLPAIGEIKLTKAKNGHAVVTVPVTYTQALSGDPVGLESSEVTLYVARKLKHGHAAGKVAKRVHVHSVVGGGTVVDHFRLDRKTSGRLFGAPRKQRGKLVRVDVRHRIRPKPGARPLHEKDASMTMASSHQAHPAGEDAFLTVRNDTSEPLQTVGEPVLCFYTNGEFGSNLQAFTTQTGRPLQPGGTIEARVEGSASIFDEAEYQLDTGEGANHWFDWEGIAVDVIANAAEIELTPILLGWDLASHCDAQASTFMLVAASESGERASSEAWVLTSETCKYGCVHTHLPTASEALGVQGVGDEENDPGVWAEDSTKVLKGLVGGWWQPPVGGKIVQDQGLHWVRQELPEAEIEEEVFDGEFWGTETVSLRAWELSIHEGSSPAGFSG
jgi:hypothetical protein